MHASTYSPPLGQRTRLADTARASRRDDHFRTASWWRRPWVQRFVLLAAFFAAIATVVPWCEFCGGMENFCVGTALETVREHHWIIPTLVGEVRTKKPPLAQWITALGLMSSSSRAWGARWPSLLMGCLTLVAIAEWGTLIQNRRLGLVAALVAGSSMLFLSFAWVASYDMQLTLWVTAANAFLSAAILRGRLWTGFTGAGFAIGLALMTKGPVAILQTVVPPLVFAGLAWWTSGVSDWHWPTRRPWLPIGVGLIVMLAVALPWTIYFVSKVPGAITVWSEQVRLKNEGQFERRFGWHSYLVLMPLMFPWVVWFGLSLWWMLTRGGWRRQAAGRGGARHDDPGNRLDYAGPSTRLAVAPPAMRLTFLWLVVPIVVMTFFPERRTRYLLPMVGPAAILAGWALVTVVDRALESSYRELLMRTHGVMLGIGAVGVPVMGALWARTVEGHHWFSPGFAMGAIGVGVGLLLMGDAIGKRRPLAGMMGGGVAAMLFLFILYMSGYARSSQGRSVGKVLADYVMSRYPDAKVYNASNRPHRSGAPLELTISFDQVLDRCPDPTVLRPGPRPQVIIFPKKAPQSAPPGFIYLKSVTLADDFWSAWVLPPASVRMDQRSSRLAG